MTEANGNVPLKSLEQRTTMQSNRSINSLEQADQVDEADGPDQPLDKDSQADQDKSTIDIILSCSEYISENQRDIIYFCLAMFTIVTAMVIAEYLRD